MSTPPEGPVASISPFAMMTVCPEWISPRTTSTTLIPVKTYFNNISSEVLGAVIDEAHKLNLKLTGHKPINMSIQEFVEIGAALFHLPDGFATFSRGLDPERPGPERRLVIDLAASRENSGAGSCEAKQKIIEKAGTGWRGIPDIVSRNNTQTSRFY